MIPGSVLQSTRTTFRHRELINSRLWYLGRALSKLSPDYTFDGSQDPTKMSVHETIADRSWKRLLEVAFDGDAWDKISVEGTIELMHGSVQRIAQGNTITLVVRPNNLDWEATRVFHHPAAV